MLAPGELYTHASIGAALFPADALTGEELLSKADIVSLSKIPSLGRGDSSGAI